mgnify:CR=1 FL=1
MRTLEVVKEAPRPCSYLPDTAASLNHRILVEVSQVELSGLLERGWRRFGPDYFRPACGNCSACLPARVPTATFAPSKSQRRARTKCAELTVELASPTCDEERLALYHRWHAFREQARGWSEAELSEENYRFQFAFPHPAGRELTYRDPQGKLVGVALCDQTDRAWSAIYFFYDPDWANRSIGTANVVIQLEIARRLRIPHVYLGYRVDACPSLAYKALFRPQEVLIGLPADDEEPEWALSLPRR